MCFVFLGHAFGRWKSPTLFTPYSLFFLDYRQFPKKIKKIWHINTYILFLLLWIGFWLQFHTVAFGIKLTVYPNPPRTYAKYKRPAFLKIIIQSFITIAGHSINGFYFIFSRWSRGRLLRSQSRTSVLAKLPFKHWNLDYHWVGNCNDNLIIIINLYILFFFYFFWFRSLRPNCEIQFLSFISVYCGFPPADYRSYRFDILFT